MFSTNSFSLIAIAQAQKNQGVACRKMQGSYRTMKIKIFCTMASDNKNTITFFIGQSHIVQSLHPLLAIVQSSIDNGLVQSNNVISVHLYFACEIKLVSDVIFSDCFRYIIRRLLYNGNERTLKIV